MWRRIRRGVSEALIDKPAPRYTVTLKHPPRAHRPRLLHVIPNVFVGGSTQLVVDLHRHLGHLYDMQVLTAALPPGGPHAGMRIHRIGLDEPADRFKPMVAALAPDLVHVHYWGSTDDSWYDPAFEAVLETGVPVIQNVNTPVVPNCDPRIAANAFVSHYVRETFAPELEPSLVIYPGIDLEAFSIPREADRDADDTVLLVYRLDPDKLDPDSLDSAIEAVKLRPRTRIVVIGEGPLLPVFVQRVREAGYRENFDFRGTVPYGALPSIYARARVFLAPVARESFGQVVPFAMAMGLGVVGNDVGALSEILTTRETLGKTHKETGAILARVLDDAQLLDRQGADNVERAQAFSLDAMIAAYEGLYADTLAQHEGRLSA